MCYDVRPGRWLQKLVALASREQQIWVCFCVDKIRRTNRALQASSGNKHVASMAPAVLHSICTVWHTTVRYTDDTGTHTDRQTDIRAEGQIIDPCIVPQRIIEHRRRVSPMCRLMTSFNRLIQWIVPSVLSPLSLILQQLFRQSYIVNKKSVEKRK